MSKQTHTSNRIVIVGGGISGLSIAVRLAQAGLPVTVLESSRLGVGASTRNQGWLYSGAWFAPDDPHLARLCHESLQYTLRFCPECLEPDRGSMVYLMSRPDTDPARWTSAWDEVGIPYHELDPEVLFERFRELAISRARLAFELPDRAVRPDRLLRRLAAAAEQAGAEIRPNTTVTRLIQHRDSVQGVQVGRGEEILAQLVILAGNAAGGDLLPEFGSQAVGGQSRVALVALKTHLVAVRPEVSRWPLCVMDAEGFNHIPHRQRSVFGMNRWLPVGHVDADERIVPEEIERLWKHIGRFFPAFHPQEHQVKQWAGTTVQAMHVDQIQPGRAPLPTIVDYAQESPRIENLLSVFPGRATLWAHLAEEASRTVMSKVGDGRQDVAPPPWNLPTSSPADEGDVPRSSITDLYHCQRCGHVDRRTSELPSPTCCETEMAKAGATVVGERDVARRNG